MSPLISSVLLLWFVAAALAQADLRVEPFALIDVKDNSTTIGTLLPVQDRDGNQYLCTRTEIIALQHNGGVRWRFPIPPLRACDVRDEGVVLVATADFLVIALSPTGQVLWKFSGDGRAGVASILSLSPSDALAVIDMSAYEFGNQDELAIIREGAMGKNRLKVPRGSQLYRDRSGQAFLITPPVDGKRRIFRVVLK